jgi:hypothetical protein
MTLSDELQRMVADGIIHSVTMASRAWERAGQETEIAALQQKRPFMVLRPPIFPDGDQWCALYGESLQAGVAGFGDTPAKAATAFDLAWLNEKAGIGLSKELMRPSAPTSHESQRNADFEAGWRTAANWMNRDDLIADIGSSAYLADRTRALASGVPASDGGQQR